MEERKVDAIDELLIDRLKVAFNAKDQMEGTLFDEIIEEMEMLIKQKPSLYKELMEFKTKLVKATEEEVDEVTKLAEHCRTPASREKFIRTELLEVDWEYRNLMLEQMITLLGKQQIMAYRQQESASMESISETDIEGVMKKS